MENILISETNDDINAQTLCGKCNQDKRKKDISFYSKRGEFGKSPNPNWMGNLELSEEGDFLVCVTVSGRVYKRTIDSKFAKSALIFNVPIKLNI
jgi:hypothetical protein